MEYTQTQGLKRPEIMNPEEIISGKESRQIEFKEVPGKGMYKTLSAFSNTDGGIILIGVADDKTVVGFDCSNDEIKQITDTIANKLLIHPLIEEVTIGGKKIIKIEVSVSSCPVSYEGRYYSRVGNTTREMQVEDLRSYFQDSGEWDCIPGNYEIDEIDEETVRYFVKISVKSKRMPPSSNDESVLEILNHLSLIQNKKITNGAIILFGKNPQRYFINAIVRVGRFKRADVIIGDKFIDGNIFRQIEEAEEAIRNYIDVRYEFPGNSFRRTEIWDYPLNSIREVLLNAVVHRDYFKSNRHTQIKIFDEHIWFYNPGGLPKGITIEDLYRPHSSVPRNPLIANVMYRANFIEIWGSGTHRISKEFVEAGLPEPEFKEEMDGFSVYFRKNAKTIEKKEPIETTGYVKSEMERNSSIQNIIKDKNLNERQIRAVKYVIENGEISNKIYQELNSISDVTAKRELKDLDSVKVLKRSGKGRTTVYKLLP